jgi:hypothetical protein
MTIVEISSGIKSLMYYSHSESRFFSSSVVAARCSGIESVIFSISSTDIPLLAYVSSPTWPAASTARKIATVRVSIW